MGWDGMGGCGGEMLSQYVLRRTNEKKKNGTKEKKNMTNLNKEKTKR